MPVDSSLRLLAINCLTITLSVIESLQPLQKCSHFRSKTTFAPIAMLTFGCIWWNESSVQCFWSTQWSFGRVAWYEHQRLAIYSFASIHYTLTTHGFRIVRIQLGSFKKPYYVDFMKAQAIWPTVVLMAIFQSLQLCSNGVNACQKLTLNFGCMCSGQGGQDGIWDFISQSTHT